MVFQIGFRHLDRRGGRGVEGRTGLQQAHDLCAAVTGALDDRVELLLRGPAHLHEVGQRNATDGRVACERHHGVAVAAEHERVHVTHRDAEFQRQEVTEAGRVQNARHADDFLCRQAGELLQRPDHRVERVGDADHERVRCVGGNAFADRFHDLEVDAQQIVAAHARLARNASRHDADIRARDTGVIVGPLEGAVEALGRARFRDVERFALRRTFGDIEQNDVTEFLDGGEMGERAADLAGADKGDLGSGHLVLRVDGLENRSQVE